MQHKKTIAIPATTKEVIDRTTCDFCGCDIKAPPFHVADVTITRKAERIPTNEKTPASTGA